MGKPKRQVVTYNLDDLCSTEAKAKGSILFKAYNKRRQEKIEKNRRKLEKALDKRRKK